MQISKTKLLTQIVLFFLLLGFVPPEYLNQNPIMEQILDFVKILSFFSVFLMYVVDLVQHIKKAFNWALLFLFMELLLATMMSQYASLQSYFRLIITIGGLIILVEELAIRFPLLGIKTLYIYFSFCTLINTLTVLLFPGAMYANNRGIWVCWFLGEDNGGYAYYIVASIYAMLYCHYITKRVTILNLLVWINSFIFVFYRDIATGKICQLLWLALFSGYLIVGFKRLLKARFVFDISIIGFILLIFVRHSVLGTIAVSFNRRSSLGRTDLWDCVLKRIMERPILGFGICSGEEFNKIALNNGLLNAHNWTLMLAFYGGIIAIILFFWLIFSACYQAKDFCSTQYYQYVSLGLVIYSVRLLVEAGNPQFLFLLLAMLVYSKEFLENINEEDCLESTSLLEFTGIPQIKLSFRRSMK